MNFRHGIIGILATVSLALAADPVMPPQLEGVGVDEKLGQSINLDLEFIGTDGYPHKLRETFAKGKPVILNLVYYTCPMLCNLVMNGQTAVLKEFAWTPGNEIEIVTISIDPTENFELARSKKATYLSSLGKDAPGWHFFVDHQGNAKRLADQIGFRYRFDGKQEQYAHPAVITVLTPQGMVSRYLYGIRFRQMDLRLALAEAAQEKFGISERILLWCYHYDPNQKSYVLFAKNVMKAGGLLTVIALGLILSWLWRMERHRPNRAPVDNNLVTAK